MGQLERERWGWSGSSTALADLGRISRRPDNGDLEHIAKRNHQYGSTISAGPLGEPFSAPLISAVKTLDVHVPTSSALIVGRRGEQHEQVQAEASLSSIRLPFNMRRQTENPR